MSNPQEFYYAVPAANSRYYSNRVYRTKKDQVMPGAFLKLAVNGSVPKSEIIKHLDIIRDWILTGEEVQTVRPDTFYLDLEAVPRLQVIRKGQAGKPKQWRGRYPKGTSRLI